MRDMRASTTWGLRTPYLVARHFVHFFRHISCACVFACVRYNETKSNVVDGWTTTLC